jgi:uncharacterized C2H2 Zn-finger protein
VSESATESRIDEVQVTHQIEPATPSETTETWTCQRCGRTFTTKQGLARHASETHGAQTYRQRKDAARKRRARAAKKAAAVSTSTPTSSTSTPTVRAIEAEVQRMAAPLQKRLVQLTADIARREQELADLRQARTYVDATLRRLNPAAPKAASTKRPTRRVVQGSLDAKRAAFRRYFDTHREQYAQGFTKSDLHRDMQRAGVTPQMSPGVIGDLLDELRDLGQVRADRVTRGGGMQWLPVQTTNGGTDGTPQT